ncbi:hypothetical protein D9M70_477370 [compost metagenome]
MVGKFQHLEQLKLGQRDGPCANMFRQALRAGQAQEQGPVVVRCVVEDVQRLELGQPSVQAAAGLHQRQAELIKG